MTEIWKDISGYEGLYQVSSEGRVRSIDRTVKTFNHKAKKIVDLRRSGGLIAISYNKQGYQIVCLCKDGIKKTKRLSVLVCTEFLGERPDGMQACHNNGIKTDNRLANLRWDTAIANQADRIAHGTDLRGEKVATAKYNSLQVSSIKSGMSFNVAKSLFGISRTQYYRILKGEAWAHI